MKMTEICKDCKGTGWSRLDDNFDIQCLCTKATYLRIAPHIQETLMVKATKSTKKATKKIAKELEAAGCDVCQDRGYYTIDKVKEPCVCMEPPPNSYDEVIRKAVTTLEQKVRDLEESNAKLKHKVDLLSKNYTKILALR